MAAGHTEYRYCATGADTAVVFVHGFLGSPSQFEYLVQRLGGRFSVENLLLPGHGATVREFARSGMKEWQRYVNDRIAELEQAYVNLILVGHSMGALLSVQAALTYPGRIRGLFLLAVPLVIRVKSPIVLKRMTAALEDTAEATGSTAPAHHSAGYADERREAAKNSNSVSATHAWHYLSALPRFVELFFKGRKTRHLISEVSVPMLVIHSEYDETVGARSLRYVERLPNAALMIAKASGHFYYPPETKALIADALETFIAKMTGKVLTV